MTNGSHILVLDLLRHGETEARGSFCGSTDVALTSWGMQQMQAVVPTRTPWTTIVSSPSRRCLDFARRLADDRQLSLCIARDLREMHFGEWEGLSVHSLNAEAPLALAQFWADPAANPPPGGERLEAFCARIDTALARLCYEHLGNTLLVVTHGGPIRYLLACARSLPSNALTSIEVPYGSLHRLRVEWTKADIPRLTEISRGAT